MTPLARATFFLVPHRLCRPAGHQTARERGPLARIVGGTPAVRSALLNFHFSICFFLVVGSPLAWTESGDDQPPAPTAMTAPAMNGPLAANPNPIWASFFDSI
jgi:hypothetical protein